MLRRIKANPLAEVVGIADLNENRAKEIASSILWII